MSRASWQYAVTLRRTTDEDVYEIREVLLGPRGELSWAEDPAAPVGSTWLDLADDLIKMEQVLQYREVLDITDPGQPHWINRSMGRPK
jgi:hypothetical protein